MIPALLAEIKPICTAALFNELAHLPASLELVRIDYVLATSDDVRSKRGTFNREVRSAFLCHVGVHHAADLTAMGLNDTAIETMREYGEYPQNTRGERLNVSIDHIRSLNFGGTNDFDNLTLLPKHLNALKDTLENLQFQKGDVEGRLVTIMPRLIEGHYPKVPYIEGGFQRAKLNN